MAFLIPWIPGIIAVAKIFVEAAAASAGSAVGSKLVEGMMPAFTPQQQPLLTSFSNPPVPVAAQQEATQIVSNRLSVDPSYQQSLEQILNRWKPDAAPVVDSIASRPETTATNTPTLAQTIADGQAALAKGRVVLANSDNPIFSTTTPPAPAFDFQTQLNSLEAKDPDLAASLAKGQAAMARANEQFQETLKSLRS